MKSLTDRMDRLRQAMVDVEVHISASLADAAQQEPFKMALAVPHPCCHCGKSISAGQSTVSTYMPVRVGDDHQLQLITWCDEDWSTLFGPLDQVPDYNRGPDDT